jgi:hypothetical protein
MKDAVCHRHQDARAPCRDTSDAQPVSRTGRPLVSEPQEHIRECEPGNGIDRHELHRRVLPGHLVRLHDGHRRSSPAVPVASGPRPRRLPVDTVCSPVPVRAGLPQKLLRRRDIRVRATDGPRDRRSAGRTVRAAAKRVRKPPSRGSFSFGASRADGRRACVFPTCPPAGALVLLPSGRVSHRPVPGREGITPCGGSPLRSAAVRRRTGHLRRPGPRC